MIASVLTVVATLLLGSALIMGAIRARNMQIWLGSYLRRKAPVVTNGPVHIMFCFVDHFEPNWGRVDLPTQRKRVDRWCSEYRALADKHRDADGRRPQHSFFYPEEEYVEEHLDKLATLCEDGYGEIEIHLHHDNDTPDNFCATIDRFNKLLHEKHGALPRDPVTGQLRFGFIHGNWCLDNSRADGRWCGINNELILLRELGCYADFTLPSAPSETQTQTINAIYYATDDPLRPKSHNTRCTGTCRRHAAWRSDDRARTAWAELAAATLRHHPAHRKCRCASRLPANPRPHRSMGAHRHSCGRPTGVGLHQSAYARNAGA